MPYHVYALKDKRTDLIAGPFDTAAEAVQVYPKAVAYAQKWLRPDLVAVCSSAATAPGKFNHELGVTLLRRRYRDRT